MGAQRSLAAPGGSRVRENPHLGAFAAPRHAITETSAGGREASEGPTLFHFFGQIRRQYAQSGRVT